MHIVDPDDELMHLLELIQVKSERIKSELAQDAVLSSTTSGKMLFPLFNQAHYNLLKVLRQLCSSFKNLIY